MSLKIERKQVKKQEEALLLVIPEKIPVYETTGTLIKSIALPFTYLDGRGGHIIISKSTLHGWQANQDIKSILINFS